MSEFYYPGRVPRAMLTGEGYSRAELLRLGRDIGFLPHFIDISVEPCYAVPEVAEHIADVISIIRPFKVKSPQESNAA